LIAKLIRLVNIFVHGSQSRSLVADASVLALQILGRLQSVKRQELGGSEIVFSGDAIAIACGDAGAVVGFDSRSTPGRD
jgi:hypothetical protein